MPLCWKQFFMRVSHHIVKHSRTSLVAILRHQSPWYERRSWISVFTPSNVDKKLILWMRIHCTLRFGWGEAFCTTQHNASEAAWGLFLFSSKASKQIILGNSQILSLCAYGIPKEDWIFCLIKSAIRKVFKLKRILYSCCNSSIYLKFKTFVARIYLVHQIRNFSRLLNCLPWWLSCYRIGV